MDSFELPRGATGVVIQDVLRHLTELGVSPSWRHGENIEDRICTGTLLLDDGTGAHEFPAVASATVSPAGLTLLPHDERTVLLTRHITSARAQTLAERGWGGYADSTGNTSLRSPGLVIEITGKSDPGAGRVSTAAPFTRSGLPVTFAVLTAHRSPLTSKSIEHCSANWQHHQELRSAPSTESSVLCASARHRCSTRTTVRCARPLSRTNGSQPIRPCNPAPGPRRGSPATSGIAPRTF